MGPCFVVCLKSRNPGRWSATDVLGCDAEQERVKVYRPRLTGGKQNWPKTFLSFLGSLHGRCPKKVQFDLVEMLKCFFSFLASMYRNVSRIHAVTTWVVFMFIWPAQNLHVAQTNFQKDHCKFIPSFRSNEDFSGSTNCYWCLSLNESDRDVHLYQPWEMKANKFRNEDLQGSFQEDLISCLH